MAVFKCKMCGGTLEINNNETVAVCEYCGTKQTLPKLDDEKRAQLYDRANYFRRENEFDKAMGIYEMILSEDKEDSEAYWGIVLCRYGIEYVEEPITNKRIPTVNRAQFTSIFDDEDYKNAVEYADTLQKVVYEEEAGIIDKIQKGILAISQKEEPFDVFICYKETDSSGNRTQDSVYAQDIYTALTKEGYKVFFSRITLEDKLGSAYEPYIFAALNSAKVMLVVGTQKDNFNAVWVKNEWSRYLTLIKAGKEKTLIPVYKDVSPYDMPEEFQYLQSQDMGKIGFMQDLVRGVQKLIRKDSKPVSFQQQVDTSEASPIIKRIFIYIEDSNWEKADEFCDKVLAETSDEALAYLGKLMIEKKCCHREELGYCDNPFDDSVNYKQIMSLGNHAIASEVKGYNETIIERKKRAAEEARRQEQEKAERQRKDKIYEKVQVLIASGDDGNLKEAISLLQSIPDWKDASQLIDEFGKKLIVIEKYNEYISAYPVLREKSQIFAVKKNLMQLLQDTRIGKKEFPSYIFAFLLLAFLSFYRGFTNLDYLEYSLFPLLFLFAGLVFVIVFVVFYIFLVYLKRIGLVSTILEYEDKINDISHIPDFYSYAPEMVEYKTISDAYISEKEKVVGNKEMEEWENAKEAILRQREAEKQSQLRIAEEQYKGHMDNLKNQEVVIQEKYNREEQRLNREKTDKTSKYVTLGLLHVAEKKEIKDRLQQIDARLSALPTELNSELQKIQKQKNEALINLNKQKERIQRSISANLTIPKNPEAIVNLNMMNMARAEAKKKQKEEFLKLRNMDKQYLKSMSNKVKKYMSGKQ